MSMQNPEKNLPPPLPKGERYPGAGRKKGTPNAISVEVRELVGQMMNDPLYQLQLREDFRARKVHPTIESLIWTYHLGKPKLSVELSGALDVTARLTEEKALFQTLDIVTLEAFAKESQDMVDRALTLSRKAVANLTPQDVVIEAEIVKSPSESLMISRGSDNIGYVTHSDPIPQNPITPDDTAG